jgi:hypothetical protein
MWEFQNSAQDDWPGVSMPSALSCKLTDWADQHGGCVQDAADKWSFTLITHDEK